LILILLFSNHNPSANMIGFGFSFLEWLFNLMHRIKIRYLHTG